MDGAKLGCRIYEFRQIFGLRTHIYNFRNVIKGEPIYKGKERKSTFIRVVDNLLWFIKNREVNRFYNTYGLDIKNFRKTKDFMPYRKFSIERNDFNLKNWGGGEGYYNGYNRICGTCIGQY